MKNLISAVVILIIGIAIGAGIGNVSAQSESTVANWEITNVVTGHTGMNATSWYILRHDPASGETWISREGKPFELIPDK